MADTYGLDATGVAFAIGVIGGSEACGSLATAGPSTGLTTAARATVSLAAGWAYEAGGVRLPMLFGPVTLVASLALVRLAVEEPPPEAPGRG